MKKQLAGSQAVFDGNEITNHERIVREAARLLQAL